MGGDGLLDTRAVAEWAYQRGLHKPSVRTVVDAIASDIAQYFREEYRTSEDGQRYRAKHAVRVKQGERTMSLWANMTMARLRETTSSGRSPSDASRSSATAINLRPTSTSTT